MAKVEAKRNVAIRSLVERCGAHMAPEVVCRLVDSRDGREYLVVDNALGRALADYVDEEVEALGTVQDLEEGRLISIRDFTPCDDPDLDLEEPQTFRSRSGHRWENAGRDNSGQNGNRSQTKALQTARRLKRDRQNWEARTPTTSE